MDKERCTSKILYVTVDKNKTKPCVNLVNHVNLTEWENKDLI